MLCYSAIILILLPYNQTTFNCTNNIINRRYSCGVATPALSVRRGKVKKKKTNKQNKTKKPFLIFAFSSWFFLFFSVFLSFPDFPPLSPQFFFISFWQIFGGGGAVPHWLRYCSILSCSINQYQYTFNIQCIYRPRYIYNDASVGRRLAIKSECTITRLFTRSYLKRHFYKPLLSKRSQHDQPWLITKVVWG